MGITLGDNRYGKAENRVVRVVRDGPRHEVIDLNVSVSLSGDLAGTHLSGDNSAVLPTDTQKNTVFAFAKEAPAGEPEEFALRLAHHFVDSQPTISRAQVRIEAYPWIRITVGGRPHDHAFMRAGGETRLTTVTYEAGEDYVTAGLTGLMVMLTTGSEFSGFIKDRYTTLPETTDRIMATSVTARWRFAHTDVDWAESHAETRRLLLETFASVPSLALQQTLYQMGARVLEERPEICEVRLSLPNKHHFAYDLSPFGLDNPNEVFYAADRPYGLIEGSVVRDDAPAPGLAWSSI